MNEPQKNTQVDWFDLYHTVIKALPWPEQVEKWAELKPSHKHALDALRKLSSAGVSSAPAIDLLINRVLDGMKASPPAAVQRAGVPEAKMEQPHKPAGFAKPDDDEHEHKPAGKPLPEPGHAKGHH